MLWDIRVRPEFRRKGVGRRLIEFAEDHARGRGIRRMTVETQNVNVAACRFYARAGYALGAIDQFAYAGLPEEVRLIWFKELA
jgi:GNAT superfamily N-acetyltransferase